MPAELVPSGNLELAVEIPPAVGQRQEAAIRSGDGVKHQILDSVALLIGDPQLQALSAGQKMMVRMGPVNERRLKAKLAELRKQIATGAVAKKPGS